MKRSALFIALLLSVIPAVAAPKSYDTITTRDGKSFYECKVMHVYPDGVSFTHRNGAAKIAFKDLPDGLRRELRYDPKAEAAYQKEQAALRKAEKERQKQQEAAMQERLMEAQMAEASYLAAARQIATTQTAATPPMSVALPGEKLTVASTQTPSWVGTPITGPAVGGSSYRNGSFSRWSNYPYRYGGGSYPAGGYYSGYGYGYPYYSGYSYGGYPYGGYYYGGGYAPRYGSSIIGNWNVGHGIHVGVGIGSFGNVLRVFR
ncbi:hypothetical protein [Prosthecobacter sp.]|uniref:coiled-coil domain-containing protein n=1 Tax=Prosthecobacter sp. TaxID=1965333 RepID=UPI001D507B34|nr:hypothetical protein [Prosthecobacter sp.]MCB1279493.1 hypothetical protein [Prosthecobacter sp.]